MNLSGANLPDVGDRYAILCVGGIHRAGRPAEGDHLIAGVDPALEFEGGIQVRGELGEELSRAVVTVINAAPRQFGGLSNLDVRGEQAENFREVARGESLIDRLNKLQWRRVHGGSIGRRYRSGKPLKSVPPLENH